MIIRYVRGLALGLALGLVLGTASGVPAAAGGDPVNPWPDTVPCANGAITGFTVQGQDNLGPYVDISGWAQPCVDPKGAGEPVNAHFGFAYFPPPDKEPLPGTAYAGRLRAFDTDAETPTPFAGRFDFRGSGAFRTTSLICMLSDPHTRVTCALFTYNLAHQHPVTLTPVPVNDPRVSGPITVIPDGSDPSTNCGTCV